MGFLHLSPPQPSHHRRGCTAGDKPALAELNCCRTLDWEEPATVALGPGLVPLRGRGWPVTLGRLFVSEPPPKTAMEVPTRQIAIENLEQCLIPHRFWKHGKEGGAERY